MSQQPILIVVTSADTINAERKTGLWLEEFAVPYLRFRRQGYAVTVASPKGGAIPIDPKSQASAEQNAAWPEAIQALQQTLPLDTVSEGDFAAIFLPGGHGTMFDLPNNVALGRLLAEFDAHGKVVAAVCHGPAGFVGALRKDGSPLVKGRKVTAFTDSEERAAQLDKDMPFMLESRLRDLGAQVETKADFTPHVEVDGDFITGQNPMSSDLVADAVIERLASKKAVVTK